MSLDYFILREAIASVSLSHDQSCCCDVCKAGAGDEGAMARVIESVRTINETGANEGRAKRPL